MKKIRKQIYQYIAVFEPEEDGGYTVTFPELPGCITFGRTMKEARVMAKEVMQLWLEVDMEYGSFIQKSRLRPRLVKIAAKVPTQRATVAYAPHAG